MKTENIYIKVIWGRDPGDTPINLFSYQWFKILHIIDLKCFP